MRGSLGVDRPAAPQQRAAERDGRCEQILGAGSERIDEHYDPGQAQGQADCGEDRDALGVDDAAASAP